MSVPETIDVEFYGSPAFANAIMTDANTESGKISITSHKEKVQDPTLLKFGLLEISAVVSTVAGTLYIGELGYRIYRWIRDSESKRIVVKTPVGGEEFGPESTQEEIEGFLRDQLPK